MSAAFLTSAQRDALVIVASVGGHIVSRFEGERPRAVNPDTELPILRATLFALKRKGLILRVGTDDLVASMGEELYLITSRGSRLAVRA